MNETIFIVMESEANEACECGAPSWTDSIAAVFADRGVAEEWAKERTDAARWSTFRVKAWSVGPDGGREV